MDDKLFQTACDKIIGIERERSGIGTLSEKTMHAVLKNFYEPDPAHQEIKIGPYFADIFNNEEIIEIQTRNFNVMRKKLDFFLEKYPVTIVYPIPHHKWICWVDDDTGEVVSRRKSPHTGTIYDAFREMYKIKFHLTHPNLHLMLPLIDTEEYRLLNGWSRDKKRGSTRHDRIPLALSDEIYIHNTREYLQFIPDGLSEPFTVKDFAHAAKIHPSIAQTGVHILHHVGVLARTGKKGRAYLYEIGLSEEETDIEERFSYDTWLGEDW